MKTNTDIRNTDDVIDSRDVIARIDELTSERDDLQSELDDAQTALDELIENSATTTDDEREAAEDARDDAKSKRDEWEEDNAAELKALEALQEEASGYASDWYHGEALIRDSYFEEYARQFADDIGAISKDASWPATCIDWEQAARELQQDYTQVDFDGVAYWIR